MNWEEVTLNEVCETQYGYTASATDDPVGPKYLRITDIVNDSINWDTVPYCQINGSDLEKYKLNIDDIVIARTGNTTGYAKLIRYAEDAVFASYLVRIMLDTQRAYPGYVGRLIESDHYKSFVKSIKGGAAQGNANAKSLTLFKFRLPPVPTQKRIANILEKYDALIENNRRRIELLEQAARLLYREWFVYFRFPGHEHVKIVDGIPEGWKKTNIGCVSSLISRGITPKYDDEAPGIVINQKCIRNQRVDITLARNQSKRVPEIKCLRRGDVLINSTGQGTLGRVAQYNDSIDDCTVDSHITIVRPNKDIPMYFYGQFIALMENYLTSMGRGATNQTELSIDTVGNMTMLLPPQWLANQYDECTEKMVSQIQNMLKQDRILTNARNLLLPRLMNGEIEV